MDNKQLLDRLEDIHSLTAKAILDLREVVKHDGDFTEDAVNSMKEDILRKVQLNISEFEILALELESE